MALEARRITHLQKEIIAQRSLEILDHLFKRVLYPPYQPGLCHYHSALLLEDVVSGVSTVFHLHQSRETNLTTYERYDLTEDDKHQVVERSFLCHTQHTSVNIDLEIMQVLHNITFKPKEHTTECCHEWRLPNIKNIATSTAEKVSNRLYKVLLVSHSPTHMMEQFVAAPWGL